jgi:uncharacterized LabA/DUF88 family protein
LHTGLLENYDLAVLIIGDGDFERPLQLLKAKGKQFIIMSTEGFIAREFCAAAGMHCIDMKDIKDEIPQREIQVNPGSQQARDSA